MIDSVQEFVKRSFSILSDKHDIESWYLLGPPSISGKGKVSIQRIKHNNIVWDSSCHFHHNAIFVSLCQDIILLALDDGTVHFIDCNTGFICYPCILLNDGISYMTVTEDYFIILMSKQGMIYILEYSQDNCFSCVFQKAHCISGSLIKRIYMTIELQSISISPIIETNDLCYRWSYVLNHWVENDFDIKGRFQTLEDIENAFSIYTLYHDKDKFMETLEILLPFICGTAFTNH